MQFKLYGIGSNAICKMITTKSKYQAHGHTTFSPCLYPLLLQFHFNVVMVFISIIICTKKFIYHFVNLIILIQHLQLQLGNYIHVRALFTIFRNSHRYLSTCAYDGVCIRQTRGHWNLKVEVKVILKHSMVTF